MGTRGSILLRGRGAPTQVQHQMHQWKLEAVPKKADPALNTNEDPSGTQKNLNVQENITKAWAKNLKIRIN